MVYTLNDYNQARLSPFCLPEEFEFLRSHLEWAMTERDPDILGELLDCVMAFGVPESDPAIRRGMDCLLATQNEDGSWGNPNDANIFDRYHATWAAIDGLTASS